MSSFAADRRRWSGLLLAAVLAHVGIIALLGMQLPVAHGAPHERIAPHVPGVTDPVGPSDPIFDLTPPEVRQLGGPTLLEVLEAPPAIRVEVGLRPEREVRPVDTARAPDAHLGSVRFGRAPPVT